MELSPSDVFVAVMGLTGSGKSSLIQLCTQLDVPVGEDLYSCTTAVSVYSFTYRGKKIHLIDTPGFNDSKRAESDVLEEICYWLATAYGPEETESSKRFLLNGIIYLHPLTEQKWTGASQRSVDFLKALCGPENYSCISLATTFWDQTLPARGAGHEQQLIQDVSKWGEMVRGADGVRTFRHDSGYRSAIRIVDVVLERNRKYDLRLQVELSHSGVALLDTTVGRVAQRTWRRDMESFQSQLDEARANLQNLQSDDLGDAVISLRGRLSQRETAVSSLNVDRSALTQRWTARNSCDEERLNQEVERCNQAIVSLQRSVERQQRESVNVTIYNNDSGSSNGDGQSVSVSEQLLRHERQRKKDLMAQKMAKMTSKGLNVAIAGALFGAIGTGVAVLPFLLACSVM